MSHCFAVGSIAERTPAKYLYLPTFMFCCQKMAIKIKEIKPRTVSVECLCTHVIVVHSMKLMIRSTSPFERGPGGMPVDLLLWFFNNVPSRVNTHTLTIAIVFIFLFVFKIHSQKAPRRQCCGSAYWDLSIEAAEAWIAEQSALLTIGSSD